ncbi:MAG: 2-dehydropantoate 2-reductase [Actinomycetota bacterium]
MTSPSIALIGPGAIGCAVAGGLVETGRPPVIAARRQFDHLHVTYKGGEIAAEVTVHTDPVAAGPAEVVVLAVKAHQTADAVPWIEALVTPTSTVYVLQNGIEHVERVTPLVPAGAVVVPVIINLPAIRSAPGVCAVGGRSRLTIPTGLDGGLFAELLAPSYIDVIETDEWPKAAWTKLMLNAALGGLCTLTRTDNRIFEEVPELVELAVAVMEEVIEVAAADGVELDAELPRQVISGLLSAASGHLASIVVDRLQGAPTEWDARNAVVGRMGRRHGVDTPRNDMLTTLIRSGEPDVAPPPRDR